MMAKKTLSRLFGRVRKTIAYCNNGYTYEKSENRGILQACH